MSGQLWRDSGPVHMRLDIFTCFFLYGLAFIHMQTEFYKKLCFTVYVYTGKLSFFGLSPLVWHHLFCATFVHVTLSSSTQQQKNGRQKQNSASFNISSRAFSLCADKRTSTFPWRWHWFFLHFIKQSVYSSEIFRSNSTSLSVRPCPVVDSFQVISVFHFFPGLWLANVPIGLQAISPPLGLKCVWHYWQPAYADACGQDYFKIPTGSV